MKRFFAFILAFLMLFNSVPSQAFASMLEGSPSNGENEAFTVTAFCETEGCLLQAEEHEECIIEPTLYCESEGCLLRETAAHEACAYCDTEGCVLMHAAHEACDVQTAEQPGEEQEEAPSNEEQGVAPASEEQGEEPADEEQEEPAGEEQEEPADEEQEETAVLSQDGLAVIALLESLPSAQELPDDLTADQVEAMKAELETAMNAYYELGEEDLWIIEEQYAHLVLSALELNDALYGYESSVFANYYFRLVAEDGIPVEGASVRVGNRQATDADDGYYYVNVNSSNLSVTVSATDEYEAVSATVTGRTQKNQAPVITVSLKETYNVDFRLYYYIGTGNNNTALFPATYSGAGQQENYGPSRDNTPFMLLTVNVNALRRYVAANPDAMIEYRRSPSDNTNQWEFLPENATPNKEKTMAFWNTVLASGAVDPEDLQELQSNRIGAVFYGYAMKKQRDSSLHIDGILDVVLPIYIVELYDNGTLFTEYYTDSAENDPKFVEMSEVLQTFENRLEEKLGEDVTISWTPEIADNVTTYVGTCNTGTHSHTVTVTKQNTNRNYGSETHGNIRYYSQNNVDSYYLASYSMAVISEEIVIPTVGFQARKVWNDGSNQDGLRPQSVTVQLYKTVGGTTAAVNGETRTMSRANSWTAQWTDLPKYEDGAEITYSVQETETYDGYTVSYDVDEHDGTYLVINTHTPATTSVSVEKAWNDNDDQDGIRPDAVTVALYADGVATGKAVELSEANDWKHTFTDLPENSYGTAVVYTLVETPVTGYTTGEPVLTDGIYVITNTHTPAVVNIPVTKVWEDNHNQDGKRPSKIEVSVYNGSDLVNTIELTAEGNWSGVFENLPKYANSTEITYTVKETAVSGYSMVEVDADGKVELDENGEAVVMEAAPVVNGKVSITNYHKTETVDLKVTKQWDDNNNLHLMRADAVKIALYANGEFVSDKIFAGAVNKIGEEDLKLTHIWEDMPRYEGGAAIEYTLAETHYYQDGKWVSGTVPHYSVDHKYDVNAHEAVVINKYTPETTSLNIRKIWNDSHNQDGLRPDSISFEIWWTTDKEAARSAVDTSGESLWNPVEINSTGDVKTAVMEPQSDGSWLDITVTGLPVRFNDSRIYYGVVETPVDGYETAYAADPDTGVVVVTNTHTPATTSLSVEKAWNDNDDQDGIRPDTVTVTLYADGEATNNSAVLNAENGWKHTFTALPENSYGTAVVYTVVEAPVDGYEFNITGSQEAGYTITNTHQVEKISIPVNKIWVDQNNNDEIRPDAVTVTLYANGEATDKVLTLNVGNGFRGTFRNLDKNAGGEAVAYTVVETPVDGYETNITGSQEAGYTITNTHEIATVDVTANKIWAGEEETAAARPQKIVLHLLKNGAHVGDSAKSVVVPAEGEWPTVTWEDLPRYEQGDEIEYTVTEEAVTDYESSYSYGKDEAGNVIAAVTNTYKPHRRNITVEKLWNDAWNQDNLRPLSIRVELYANGKATGEVLNISRDNNWIGQFTNKIDSIHGEKINYTVVEIGYTDASGYHEGLLYGENSVAYSTDEYTGNLEVVNSHTPETVDVSVAKIWEDANNQDGIRPASVQVTLYRNGVATDNVATLDASNGWSYIFKDLDEHHGIGVDNVYTVREAVPNGYTASITGRQAEGYTITNTHTPAVVNIPVSKVWEDNHNQDGKRPGTITLSVFEENGEAAVQTITLNAADNWTGSFTNLPEFRNGIRINYVVKEAEINGYTMVKANEDGTFTGVDAVSAANGQVTVINYHELEKTTVSARKVWADSGDQDDVRPASVTLHLLANGEHTEKTAVLSEANNWAYTWTDLDKNADGQPIRYVVQEQTILDDNGENAGYVASYARETDGTIVVTNTRETDKTSRTVQKIWDDQNNQDGLRTESVTVQLLADGEVYTEAVLNAANNWKHTFDNIPVNKEGQQGEPISYSVQEINVPDGYNAKPDTDTHTGTLTITNTHEVLKTQVKVSKVWYDNNDQDGLRPETVTLTLYADGEVYLVNGNPYTITLQANEEGKWEGEFTDLPLNSHGTAVVYTVVEAPVDGYEFNITGTQEAGYTITNTHQVEKTSVSVNKGWVDQNNNDEIRPDAVTVTLYANGEATDKVLTLNVENGFQGTFQDLDKNAGGEAVAYTVVETPVAGYESKITGSQEAGYTITNTHEIATVDVTAVKIWAGSEETAAARPQKIVLHLLKNGAHVGGDAMREVVPGADGVWPTVTWENLPRYEQGDVIVYTVTEEAVADYSRTYSHVTDDNGNIEATITNTYTPARRSVVVEKLWDDAWNQDNLRPLSIRVELYADGKATGEVLDISREYNWIGQFANKIDSINGEKINYTVVEIGYTDARGYHEGLLYGENSVTYSTDEHTGDLEVVNHHTPKTVEVSVTKEWEDADNQDDIRPDSVQVTLYRNGVATDNVATLDASNGWSYIFKDLDEHHGIGVDNVYTVKETPVDGYESEITGSQAEGYTITNTHTPEQISIPVTKVWNDTHNQDGKRPVSITLAVMDGETQVETVTLNAAGNWSGSFTGLTKFRAGKVGEEIVYTVKEIGYTVPETVDGVQKEVYHEGLVYGEGSVSVETNNDGSVKVTNTHTPETVVLEVTKKWDDNKNLHLMRADAVKIALYANGRFVSEKIFAGAVSKIGAEDLELTHIWENMPKYEGGEVINYTLEETAYYMNGQWVRGTVPHYSVDHVYDVDDHKAVVINKYTPETTSLNIQKIWKDSNNQDGLRPNSITFEIWWTTDETAAKSAVVTSGESAWKAVEIDANDTVMTAVMTPEADGSWEDITVMGLPLYYGGDQVFYSAVEKTVTGYNTTYEQKSDIGVVVVTNTHTPATTSVSVEKAWNDNDDQDGIRPDAVTVTLYADGEATDKTAELSKANGWKHTFTDLPEYSYGTAVAYTLVETPVAEYTAGEPVLTNGVYVITNTHQVEKTSVSVTKVWDDANDQDGIRPASITVYLYADGVYTGKTAVLNAENLWSASFMDLDKNAEGKPIVYSVEEKAMVGYNEIGGIAQSKIVKAENGTVTITNTHIPEVTTMTARKIWNDDDNRDGKRPASIELHLLANGVHLGEDYVRTLSSENSWTVTWTGLSKFAAGQEIKYTVYEEPIQISSGGSEDSSGAAAQSSEDYTVSYERISATEIEVTNSYTPETTVVSVAKLWDDDYNRDGKRPESVVVRLLANDKATGKSVILNADNEWTASFTGLYKYEQGKLIKYSVTEDAVANYNTTGIVQDEHLENHFVITNSYAPETTSVQVTKHWNDGDNNDGLRPNGIVVQLLANASYVEGATAVLNTENGWQYTFSEAAGKPLYVFQNVGGSVTEISYSVLEVGYVDAEGNRVLDSLEGYTPDYTVNGYSVAITNSHALEKTSVSVEKKWDDANDQDGKRPGRVEVSLLLNGVVTDTVTLSKDNGWKHTWSDLYAYRGGKAITYTVTEKRVRDYEAKITGSAEEGFVITNVHEPEVRRTFITKVWKDNDSILRPNSVTVQLYKNGHPYGKSFKIRERDGWKYPVELPVYERGERITWTVQEIKVPLSYAVSYDQSTLTITNKLLTAASNPGTGDSFNLGLWTTVMGTSGIGALMLLLLGRKKKQGRK